MSKLSEVKRTHLPPPSLIKRRGGFALFYGKAIPLEKVPLFLRERFRVSSIVVLDFSYKLDAFKRKFLIITTKQFNN